MKLRSIFIAIYLLATVITQATAPLDSVFNYLSSLPSATTSSVNYTGTFDNKIPGFIFQRGLGNGWTSGVRVHCNNIDQKKAISIFDIFDGSSAEVGHVARLEGERACFDEGNMIGYACHYDKNNKTLDFLRADVEDQLCIPVDWFQRGFYDGSVSKVQKQLSQSEWVASLAKLYTELKYNYVFYDKNKERIDSAYREIFPLMTHVSDNYDAYRLLSRFIASCNDGHTYIYSTGIIEQPTSSPFTTKLIANKVYIDNVESSILDSAGMKRGMEVIAVNAIPVKLYGDSLLAPYISSSTSQWTNYKIYDNYGLSSGKKGNPLNITLSDGENDFEIFHNIGDGKRDLHKSKYDDTLVFKLYNGNIGYLKIPDFQSSTVTDLFDKVYDDILGTEALVIDIRGNGGGNSEYADYIASHFSNDSIKSDSWRSPKYIPAFASWGYDTEWYESSSVLIPPVSGKPHYLKPLVILTDQGTFSAAEDFSGLFKGMNRAIFIGTPTGGSTGNGVRIKLNSLVSANICSKHDTAPDGKEFVGIGIIPDIFVEDTHESYFSGYDIFILKALEYLNSLQLYHSS